MTLFHDLCTLPNLLVEPPCTYSSKGPPPRPPQTESPKEEPSAQVYGETISSQPLYHSSA